MSQCLPLSLCDLVESNNSEAHSIQTQTAIDAVKTSSGRQHSGWYSDTSNANNMLTHVLPSNRTSVQRQVSCADAGGDNVKEDGGYHHPQQNRGHRALHHMHGHGCDHGHPGSRRCWVGGLALGMAPSHPNPSPQASALHKTVQMMRCRRKTVVSKEIVKDTVQALYGIFACKKMKCKIFMLCPKSRLGSSHSNSFSVASIPNLVLALSVCSPIVTERSIASDTCTL